MIIRKPPRLAWLTDVHFEFLEEGDLRNFLQELRRYKCNGYMISGDISIARYLEEHLEEIEKYLKSPIYFVLGNHDFYGSSLDKVSQKVSRQTSHSKHLFWLNQEGIIPLNHDTALIGHDSWSDGRLGNYEDSDVFMNDYFVIKDFAGLDKMDRWLKLQILGDQAADYFRKVLPEALEKYDNIFLLTHIPPFRESCWHEGGLSDDNWLPHFTCQAVGDTLKEIMKEYPHKNLVVLCGHTHGDGQAQVSENILVLTGGAEYCAPHLQRIFDFE